MFNKKLLSLKILLFLICEFLIAVKAEIEIPDCQRSMDLTSVVKCKDVTEDITAEGYCMSATLLYVLDKDDSALCYHSFPSLSTGNYLITLDGKSMSIKTFITSSSISIDVNTVANMAAVLCYKQSSITCSQINMIVKSTDSKYYAISNKKTITNGELDVSATSCSSNIGKLATIDNKVVLCLGNDKSVAMSASKNRYFLEGSTATGSPFYVDDSKDGILIKPYAYYFINDVTVEPMYVYRKYTSNIIMNKATDFSTGSIVNKLYKCEMGVCKIYKDVESGNFLINKASSTDPSNLYVFKNEGDDKTSVTLLKNSGVLVFNLYEGSTESVPGNIYQLIDDAKVTVNPSDEIFSNSRLFSCQYGDCFATIGYIKYTDSSNNIKVNKCSDNCGTTIENTFGCSSIADNGIIAYDSTDSKFKICIFSNTGSEIKYIAKEIKENDYIFRKSSAGSTSYTIYKVNKDATIIGYSKSAGKILGDVENNGEKQLISCTNSYSNVQCSVIKNAKGYYLNFGDDLSNSLIYADDAGFNIITKDNGYFTNSNKDIIECSMSLCKSINTALPTCISNDGKLIYKVNNNIAEIKYCNGVVGQDLSDTEKYYILSSVNASATYPVIQNGKDTIIIKADLYSVTQVTTSKDGICINTSTNEKINGKCSGTTYYCSSICKSCTSEYNKKEKYDPSAQISNCANYIEDDNKNANGETNGDTNGGTNGKNDSSGSMSIFAYSKLLNLIIIAIITIILI